MADRRQTHLQLYRLVQDALDEAGTARWDKIQVASRLNMAYADWFHTHCKRALEKDEAARRELGPLTITSPQTLTEGSLNLETLDPTLYRILSVDARWQRTVVDRCTRKRSQRLDTWPVSPIRHDQLQAAIMSAWNTPSDDAARYSESKHKADSGRPLRLTIHSQTVPTGISLTYVYEPKLIDIQANPTEMTEVGYDTQLELVRRAAAMLLTPEENYPAAQAQYGEVQIANT